MVQNRRPHLLLEEAKEVQETSPKGFKHMGL
jgi:hypothetical protein